MRRIGIICLLLAGLATGRDRKAARLAEQAVEAARSGKETWKRLILEPDQVTDAEVDGLIDTYERAVDLYQKSLEVEEDPSLNGQIVLLAQRLSKLEYERFYRRQHRKRQEEASQPPEEAAPERKPEPRSEPEPERAAPERAAAPAGEAGVPPYPQLFETKKRARRNQQRLRDFIMNGYFAPRKRTTLLTRCAVCNGGGRVRTGHVDKYRRPVTVTCPTCKGTGYHLNPAPVRKALWLSMSPLYRANGENRSAFEARLAAWRKDPRTFPEVLKRLRILSTDYHGFWARVRLQESGYDIARKRPFRRTAEKTCLRIGRHWFLYSDAFDRALFQAPPSDD